MSTCNKESWDKNVELIRLANIALSEIGYGEPLRCVIRNGRIVNTSSIHIPIEIRMKALRLANMHLDGPDKRALCDFHIVYNSPDLWDQCSKIPVRNALMGILCDNAFKSKEMNDYAETLE